MSTNYTQHIVECMQNEKISKELKLKKIKYIMQIAKDSLNGYYERKTPLYWAEEMNDKDFIELFKQHGGKKDKRPPTHEERIKLNEELVLYTTAGMLSNAKTLLDDGADIEASVTKDKRNPLIVFCAGSRDVKTVEFLLDNGAYINTVDQDGITPLLNAVIEERYYNVKLLVERGANISIQTPWGKNALEIANDDLKAIILEARKTWCQKNNVDFDKEKYTPTESQKPQNTASIFDKLKSLIH